MSKNWGKIMLIPQSKEKAAAKECISYRNLKILEHAMKVMKRIFEKKIKRKVETARFKWV